MLWECEGPLIIPNEVLLSSLPACVDVCISVAQDNGCSESSCPSSCSCGSMSVNHIYIYIYVCVCVSWIMLVH